VWTLNLLSPDPCLAVEVDKDLKKLIRWLLSRIWPKRYPKLEYAFKNFYFILQDFLYIFHRYSKEVGDRFFTEKFYQINESEKLFKEYIFHINLIQDLILELTRAANYICDKVRKFIDPTFRLKEGLLIITSGPYFNSEGFYYLHHRVEYKDHERIDIPYPGLEEFKKIRTTRDYYFGVGLNIEDENFKNWYVDYY